MKARFILFRRAGMYYCEDTVTRKQTSLRTKKESEAVTMLNARNESFRQPQLNIQIARAYLTASDPAMSTRTWQAVMDQLSTHGKPHTQTRCARAMRSRTYDGLRNRALMETNAGDFLTLLKNAKVSEVHYLRRLHNLAIRLGWLALPVLAPRLWPKPQYKIKRGITPDEHAKILADVKNAERNFYY